MPTETRRFYCFNSTTFQARTYQLPIINPIKAALGGDKNAPRLHCWVAHRRSGKDATGGRCGAYSGIKRPNSNNYLVAPSAKQATKIWWRGKNQSTKGDYLDEVFPPLIRKDGADGLNKTEKIVTLRNGSQFQLVNADEDKILGTTCHFVE